MLKSLVIYLYVILSVGLLLPHAVAEEPAGDPDDSISIEDPDDSTRIEDPEMEDPEMEDAEIDADGSLDDSESSIEAVEDKRGWAMVADIRTSYVFESLDFDNIVDLDDDLVRSRLRLNADWAVSERLRFSARIAGLWSTNERISEFILQPEIPTRTGIKEGQVTFDELFVHWHRRQRSDLAVGRLQTKFVARGGVFAKSLDRNDSNNLRVNWTDGLYGTLRHKSGWTTHMILQYNAAEGPGNVRWSPLDFSDSETRTTYFVAFENRERSGMLLQRGLDISYLPATLLKNGSLGKRREDYWGLVARAAIRLPARGEGTRLRVSSEIGYAPETQTNRAENIAGEGDTDGLAWNFTASIMDFLPNHSIGINYGQTGAGWLLSPQYRNNEELFEIRYLWRKNRNLAVDLRGRWRTDLERSLAAPKKREAFDLYLRLTWGISLKSL
jgi:hypothetical protein